MKKSILSNPLIQIHLAVFLWGFTAILGKLISIDTLGLVFLRMVIASIGFIVLTNAKTHLKTISKTQFWKLVGIGLTICIHWLCFYQSIKEYNSSSLALICLGLGPMFVIWIEYLLGINRKLNFLPILISIVAFAGLYFVSKGSNSEVCTNYDAYFNAIYYGIAASFLAAFFTIMNRSMAQEIDPGTLSFIEIGSGAVCLYLYHLFFLDFRFIQNISMLDLSYIFVLSIVCTNLPFLLSIYALQKLDAFIVTLSVNLEPIYGLIFAAILFHEYDGFNSFFYLGSFLITLSVFLPLIESKLRKKSMNS